MTTSRQKRLTLSIDATLLSHYSLVHRTVDYTDAVIIAIGCCQNSMGLVNFLLEGRICRVEGSSP